MRNLLLIGLIICVLMVSCKKDQHHQLSTPHSSVKKYPMVFKGGSASRNQSNSRGIFSLTGLNSVDDTTTLATAGIDKYYFVVYDSTGKEVDRISNTMTSQGVLQARYIVNGVYQTFTTLASNYVTTPFDLITDSLAVGKYTVIILGDVNDPYFYIDAWAEGDQLHGGGPNYSPLSTAFFSYEYLLTARIATVDTFMYKGSITVGPQGLTQSYVLTRIVGQVVVNIEDTVPDNVTGFSFQLYNECMGLTLNDLQTVTTADSPDAGAFYNGDPRGKTNFQFSRPILNTTSPMKVVAQALDSSYNVVASKTFDSIQFTKNQVVLLTGKFFTGTTTNSVKKVQHMPGNRSTIIHF